MLKKVFESKHRISLITCYDYTFAKIVDDSSVDGVLVGDSLACTMQGFTNTVPVTLDEMIYHTKCVKRAIHKKPIIVDLPFSSYQISIEKAMVSVYKVFKETLCDAVKIEGGYPYIYELVSRLKKQGIPVMGHLGFTPQFIDQWDNIKTQKLEQKEKIKKQAIDLEKAGIFSIVLEMIPKELAKDITENLTIPTIGIGSGNQTRGQVLVLQDLLGMNPNFQPKFLKKYTNLYDNCLDAFNDYNQEVKNQIYPSDKQSY